MTRTRAAILSIIGVFAAAATLWYTIGPSDEPEFVARPEVLAVGPAQVTIAWQGDERSQGVVWYRPVAGQADPVSASDDLGPDTRHEVVIRGLQPGSRYVYWLGRAETGRRYEFQTAPIGEMPCWFLLTWGDVSDSVAALVVSELPEFAVSLTQIAPGGVDPLSPVRPFMPVYDPGGISSPYLRGAAGAAAQAGSAAWSLDWGGLRIVVIGAGADSAAALLRSPAAHTVGVIYHAPAAADWLTSHRPPVEIIRASALHRAIASHNATRGEGKVAFVILPSRLTGKVTVDDVQYVGIATADAGAARVDVAPESSQLVFLTGQEPTTIVLKRPLLQQKRTCAECRRLANRGAYLKSIEAYEQFIAANQSHYQIDDAYYAIAEILDERLFQFADAVTWYRRLIAQYSDSALAPMARRRIAYLQTHSDADYAPLARFERIRRVEFARSQQDPAARAECLAGAAEVLSDYPDCSMAPTILYWLANQHRREAPDAAATLYRVLLGRFPASRQAKRAWLEMGETYYATGQYAKAMAVFEEALAADGADPRELATQMARARRNLRRGHLKIAAWLILAVLGAGALLIPPIGMARGGLGRAAGAFAALALTLLCGGWLIREQFASSGEMALLCIGLAAAGALPAPLTATLGLKLCRATHAGASPERRRAGTLCGCVLGLAFSGAGMYLLIYTINEHYLVVAGL